MTGDSFLIIGPSGAGKSTLPATAFAAEGAGVALLAPGDVELASYRAFVGKPDFRIEAFGDPLFQPSVGLTEATGLAKATRFLLEIRKELEATPGKYPFVVVDTGTGIGNLATNVALKRMNVTVPPVARSQDGATYYTGLGSSQQQFYDLLLSLKAFGATVMVCCHAVEKENLSETAVAGLSGAAIIPAVPGGFSGRMAGLFDLVLYAGIEKGNPLADGHNDPAKPRHYLKWAPDPKRPTKSKFGALNAGGKPISNEWGHLKPLLEKARGG